LAAYDRASRVERLVPQAGTLGGLLEAYLRSSRYEKLADRSKRDYRRLLDQLKPLDGMALAEIDRDFLEGLQRKLLPRLKWRRVNYLLDILRAVWSVGLKAKLVRGNPFEGLDDVPRPADLPVRNARWPDAAIDAAIEVAGERKMWGVRAALALAASTGMRKADLLRVSWDAVTGDRITFVTQKTGTPVDVQVTPTLARILKSTPRSTIAGVENIVINDEGRAYSENGLASSLKKLLLRVTAERGTKTRGLALHGLRHTVGSKLAEGGANERTIQAVLGHTTGEMARKYTRTAERKTLGGATAMLTAKRRATGSKKRKKTT
jgi:integrase